MTTATLDDLQSRAQALTGALAEAQTRCAQLTARRDETAAARHQALTAADFTTATKHERALTDVETQLRAAQASTDAVLVAQRAVGEQIRVVQHQTRRDQLVDAIAAAHTQGETLLQEAKAEARTAHAKILAAVQAEQNVTGLETELHGLRISLEEIPNGQRLFAAHPISDAVSADPLLTTLAAIRSAP